MTSAAPASDFRPAVDVLPEAESEGPMRRCIAQREARAAAGMIRFVIGPDGSLVPDLGAKLPGRGLWVSAERPILAMALKRNLFAKVAREPVRIPNDVVEQVEATLARRCLDTLGLARRAGVLVAGFDQVGEALRGGQVGLVFGAHDAAEDGRRKIAALAGSVPVVDAFARAELGRAIGRDEIVHVAVARGRLQRRLLTELRRLSGFRTFSPLPAPVGGAVSQEDLSAR